MQAREKDWLKKSTRTHIQRMERQSGAKEGAVRGRQYIDMRNKINSKHPFDRPYTKPLLWWWIAISIKLTLFSAALSPHSPSAVTPAERCTFTSFNFISELKFIFNRVLINYLSACNLIKSLLSASGLAQLRWTALLWKNVEHEGGRAWQWGWAIHTQRRPYGRRETWTITVQFEDNLFKANEQWIIFAVINPPQFFRQTALH